jgi:hypothetical protein
MPWGRVRIAYAKTGYNQYYKRNNVKTHKACKIMVAAAVVHAVAKIGGKGAKVTRSNIAYKLAKAPKGMLI